MSKQYLALYIIYGTFIAGSILIVYISDRYQNLSKSDHISPTDHVPDSSTDYNQQNSVSKTTEEMSVGGWTVRNPISAMRLSSIHRSESMPDDKINLSTVSWLELESAETSRSSPVLILLTKTPPNTSSQSTTSQTTTSHMTSTSEESSVQGTFSQIRNSTPSHAPESSTSPPFQFTSPPTPILSTLRRSSSPSLPTLLNTTTSQTPLAMPISLSSSAQTPKTTTETEQTVLSSSTMSIMPLTQLLSLHSFIPTSSGNNFIFPTVSTELSQSTTALSTGTSNPVVHTTSLPSIFPSSTTTSGRISISPTIFGNVTTTLTGISSSLIQSTNLIQSSSSSVTTAPVSSPVLSTKQLPTLAILTSQTTFQAPTMIATSTNSSSGTVFLNYTTPSIVSTTTPLVCFGECVNNLTILMIYVDNLFTIL